MFESHDWSPQLKKAAENFARKFLSKAKLPDVIEELEYLLTLAEQEGFDVGFAEAGEAPEREEDYQ